MGEPMSKLSDGRVRRIYAAGGGASVDTVIEAIENRRRAGFLPGAEDGPYSWKWYEIVVANYMREVTPRLVPFSQAWDRSFIDDSLFDAAA